VLTLGWDNCVEWPRVVLHGETDSSNIGLIAPAMMQNVRGILNLMIGDDTSMVRMISAGLCIITIFLIGYLWTAPYKKLQHTTKYAFEVVSAVSMMIVLLFSVHTHAHDYCVFVCSCVWLYVAALDLAPSKAVSYLKFFLVGFPIFGWLLFVAQPIIQHILKLQPLAVYLAIVLGLAFKSWFLTAPVSADQSTN